VRVSPPPCRRPRTRKKEPPPSNPKHVASALDNAGSGPTLAKSASPGSAQTKTLPCAVTAANALACRCVIAPPSSPSPVPVSSAPRGVTSAAPISGSLAVAFFSVCRSPRIAPFAG